jgi:FkbM family methyltransferase
LALKLGTKFLFHRLLKAMKPDLVCDIGSMDASDARRFRRFLPHARIIAFEGNPDNIASLRQDERLRKDRIDLQGSLVGSRNGKQKFFIENLSEGEETEDVRRGISSTRIRTRNSLGSAAIEIDAVRLDTFIRSLDIVPDSVALWIDVEGAAYEVLEGIEKVCDRIKLIHVEVETEAFWEGQRLKADVEDLARSMGFITLARGRFEPQHDLVLMNGNTFSESPFKYKRMLYAAWILTNRLKIFSRAAYNITI